MRGADGSNLSRRAVLLRGTWLGALALALAACREPRRHSATPDPDGAALAAEIAHEVQLLQMYDAAIEADRGGIGWLSIGRDAHKAHLDALTTRPQLIARSSPSPSPEAQQLAALVATERDSAARLRAAAVAVHDGEHAALLASIAAAHEAHTTVHPVVATQ